MSKSYDPADAIKEHVTYYLNEGERDWDALLEHSQNALHEDIDNELIYTYRVLELWNGDTDQNICLSDYDTLIDAVTASVYFQLSEYDYLVEDTEEAIREWAVEQSPPTDWEHPTPPKTLLFDYSPADLWQHFTQNSEVGEILEALDI